MNLGAFIRRRMGGTIGRNYLTQPLTFRALEDGTFSFSVNPVKYSLDGGSTWTILPAGQSTPTIYAGQRIMWMIDYMENPGQYEEWFAPTSSAGLGTFSSTGKFDAEGNIMSLWYGTTFASQTALPLNYMFRHLFEGGKVCDCRNLKLPATTLTDYCYADMFYQCDNLHTPAELPALTMVQYCYYDMYYGCNSLYVAPELPATTLAKSCYGRMFYFSGLRKAPALRATTLAENCYQWMFNNCLYLEYPPALPATTLATRCYDSMFYNCKALKEAPVLPATTLATYCYYRMFYNCRSLLSGPVLPAATLVNNCYYQMFYGCSNMRYLKCMATDISASNCTKEWLQNVAGVGYGHFVRAAGVAWSNDQNGYRGWTLYTGKTPVAVRSLYSLENYETDGSIATAINTGLKLYGGSFNGFRLRMEFLPKDFDVAEQCTYASCKDESDYALPGFTIRHDANDTQLEMSAMVPVVENDFATDGSKSFRCEVLYDGFSLVMVGKLGTASSVAAGSAGVTIHQWPMTIGGVLATNGNTPTWKTDRWSKMDLYRLTIEEI